MARAILASPIGWMNRWPDELLAAYRGYRALAEELTLNA
jgi:hypothetical protein